MEDIDSNFPYTKGTGTEAKGTGLSDEALKDDGQLQRPLTAQNHWSSSWVVKTRAEGEKQHTIKFSTWPETKWYFMASNMCVLLFELKFLTIKN